MRRLLTIVALAVSVAFTCSSLALGARGSVSGKVSEVPGGSAFDVVTAIDTQGEIGGVATTNASGGYSLTLPPGTWLIANSSDAADALFGGFSAPVRVRAGSHAGAGPIAVAPTATAAATGDHKLKPGSVVTFAPILIEDRRPPVHDNEPVPIELTNYVVNDVFSRCASKGIEFADTSPQFTAFARQESGLSAAGKLATPFVYKPVHAQYQVTALTQLLGAGVVEIGLELSSLSRPGFFFDIVVAQLQLPNIEENPTDSQLIGVVHEAGAKLAAKMCGG